MAINLVSLVSQFFTPQLIGSLARALGVNEAVAQKLVAAAVPAILASLGTAAAAPGGAQKVSDTVSNSDPDILSKIGQAASGGNVRFLNEGSTLLSGALGGGGLSSLVGALSQYSGATHPATQSLLGAVTHVAVGTIGQQDPSNWSDPSGIFRCSTVRRARSPRRCRLKCRKPFHTSCSSLWREIHLRSPVTFLSRIRLRLKSHRQGPRKAPLSGASNY